MLVELELVGPVYGRAHLLREAEWVLREGWAVGASVWLDDPEVGTTSAAVTSIEHFEVQPGEGCAVTATVEHDTASTVDIAFEDGSHVEATPVHPFFVPEANGFVPAGELHGGSVVGLLGGGRLRVEGVTTSLGSRWVFNLEVEVAESYGVGLWDVWVHNHCAARRDTGPIDHPEDLVPSLRPPLQPGSSAPTVFHPMAGVARPLQQPVGTILNDIMASRAGDAAAAARLAARNSHQLTGNLRGWTSVDILGRADPRRLLYRWSDGGIVWRIENTH
jgi:hypothetical protein